MDYQAMERELTAAFELRRRPIAIAFQDAPPAGIAKFAGTVPSGCSFWKIAAEGRPFYTVPSDHYNCAWAATRTTSSCRKNAPANSSRRSRS
jgi:hypothetical protein